MRNVGINIILFTSSKPNHYGTLGALRYSARTVAEVGAYLARANDQQWKDFGKTNSDTKINEEAIEEQVKTVEETDEEDISEEVIIVEETVEVETSAQESEFADAPDATKLYSGTPVDTKPRTATILQHSDSESLKTKDLALEYV
jgi:hypothetical protein